MTLLTNKLRTLRPSDQWQALCTIVAELSDKVDTATYHNVVTQAVDLVERRSQIKAERVMSAPRPRSCRRPIAGEAAA